LEAMFYLGLVVLAYAFLFTRDFAGEEEPPEGFIRLHYHGVDPNLADWLVWTWEPGKDQGEAFAPKFSNPTELIFEIPKDPEKSLGFLPFQRNWQAKDGEDRILSPHLRHRVLHLRQGHQEITVNRPNVQLEIQSAFLDSRRTIQVQFPLAIDSDFPLDQFQVLDSESRKLDIESVQPKENGDVDLVLVKPLDLGDKTLFQYQVRCKRHGSSFLIPRGILYDPEYYYEEKLGFEIVGDFIHFRSFSPLSRKVDLLIFGSPEANDCRTYPMKEERVGLYHVKISRDKVLDHWYEFSVQGDEHCFHSQRELGKRKAIDPYAKCLNHRLGRAFIFEDKQTVHESPKIKREDTVIYELHLRDISVSEDSGMVHKGKYLCLTEEGSRVPGTKIKTGLDHLKELGVNTIQILPFTNFDQDDLNAPYDWGYMPMHFFCPHGGYASDPSNLSRITDLKDMVSALHKKGFQVIMDTVLNHTAEGSMGVINFQAIAPGYYYRRRHDGSFFNGSGCGNEFKSESPMGRKYILDCLKYWMQEFGIDGFRFDLMGLMDYETMVRIEEELKAINPNVLLYGEPWVAAQSGVPVYGKGAQRDRQVSVFNDHFRDALRGDNSPHDKGFLQGSGDGYKVLQGIMGSIQDFASKPLESINYVACHDNYTLRDKLLLSTRDLESEEKEHLEVVRSMEKICAVVLFTSFGIPFLHNGQEFGRSKNFDHNSYQSPDEINQIVWTRKQEEKDLFDFHKNMIKLRSQHRMLRRTQRHDIEEYFSLLEPESCKNFPSTALGYKFYRGDLRDSFEEMVVIVNPGSRKGSYTLEKGTWHKVLFNGKFHLKNSTMPEVKEEVEIQAWDQIILARLNQEEGK